MFNIPILCYHKISDTPEVGLTSIGLRRFEEHLRYLSDSGYSTITFKTLHNKSKLPAKPVIITFDDAYAVVYENALPILMKFNMTAVVFVISDYIGKINTWESFPIQRKYKHLDAEQLVELSEIGFEIGSHSSSHRYLPFADSSRLHFEISESKQKLQEMLGTDIISFCYPYGRYNKRVMQDVGNAGYFYALCNIALKSVKSTSLSLQRRSVYSIDRVSFLNKKLNNSSRFSIHFLSEWIIQKGALAGICLKLK